VNWRSFTDVILRVAITRQFVCKLPELPSIFLFKSFSRNELGEGLEKKNATYLGQGG
jgi:hypothetical protein